MRSTAGRTPSMVNENTRPVYSLASLSISTQKDRHLIALRRAEGARCRGCYSNPPEVANPRPLVKAASEKYIFNHRFQGSKNIPGAIHFAGQDIARQNPLPMLTHRTSRQPNLDLPIVICSALQSPKHKASCQHQRIAATRRTDASRQNR